MNRYSLIRTALLAALLAFSSGDRAQAESAVALADTATVQGGIVRLDVASDPPPDTVTGTFRGKALPFIHSAEGGFYTLLGVDMETKPGIYRLEIRLHRAKKKRIPALSRG